MGGRRRYALNLQEASFETFLLVTLGLGVWLTMNPGAFRNVETERTEKGFWLSIVLVLRSRNSATNQRGQ